MKFQLKMEKLAEFVSQHMSEDTARLIMNRSRWPEIDMDMAVNSIESRRKLRGKVQQWYDEPRLVFPLKLSAEQCSSSSTGLYKAGVAAHIAGKESWKIADLTGGLGVDSWFFSQKAANVLYNEMQEPLCRAAKHNFEVLGAKNIEISNHAIGNDDGRYDTGKDLFISPTALLKDFRPDIIYMDPARRGEGGKKVFLIEECTPDVLTLKDEIFGICRHILIKLSPMADITMVCSRMGSTCREVHVVASGGECKELLIWMDKEWSEGYTINAVELRNDGTSCEFRFTPCEEKTAPLTMLGKNDNLSSEFFLFEPGKALMKAGAFNTVCRSFRLVKLGISTHYYVTADQSKAEELKKFGKVFRIIRCEPLDKRSIKAAGKEFPRSEVTARNIPMDTDTLRKKTGVTSGDDAHIFGLKCDSQGNLLIVAQRY